MAVPVSLIVSSGLLVVSAAYGSARLAFVVTFLLSYVFLERLLSPRIDRFFRQVDAVVLGDLLTVRDFIRDEPLTASIYAAAEDRARRARAFVADAIGSLETETRATLSGAKDAAAAAFLWLRLGAGVANLVATLLMNAAFDEARSRAPQVLRWRGVKGLTASPPNEEGSAPEPKKSTMFLVLWIAAILAYCAQMVTVGGVCSGMASFRQCFPCLAALCGFALMEAERLYLWGSYAIDTTTGSSDTANPGPDASQGVAKEKDLQDAWTFLWFLVTAMHGIDAILVARMLGKRPFVLAALAIYNLSAVKAARQAYLTADDADGAPGSVSRWRRAVLKVLTMDVAKVVAAYLAIDYYLGASLFVPLCAKTALLLDITIHLSEDDASNQEVDGISENIAGDVEGSDHSNQEGTGLAEDLAGYAQGSNDDNQEGAAVAEETVACDHDSSDTVARDHEEEEGSTTEEHSNVSDSEDSRDHQDDEGSTTAEHSDVSDSEEPRQEESDNSSNSSSSMDGWSFIGVDVEPTMPADVNGGVGRKFWFFK
jgi:hypothetical protein